MSSRGYIDPNFPNPRGKGDIPIIIYGYTPSQILAIIAIATFGITAILHLLQAIRARLRFLSVLVIGGALEIVGYIFRLFSARKSPYNVTFYVVQYFFIVVAPVFFSAGIYACLSRLIRISGFWTGKGKAILGIFVTCDIVATVAQIIGAALIGVKESRRLDSSGANRILLAGLAFQTFTFLIFLCLLLSFQRCVSRYFVDRTGTGTALFKGGRGDGTGVVTTTTTTPTTTMTMTTDRNEPSQLGMTCLFLASLLFFVRTVFRLAETAEGVFGYLSTHEVFFATLEYLPVILALFILNASHPGTYSNSRAVKVASVELTDR